MPDFMRYPIGGYTDWISTAGLDKIQIEEMIGTSKIILKNCANKDDDGDSFKIVDVIFHDPATIVFWSDGTKTVVKCGEKDTYDPEKGLAMAIVKKVLGNKGRYYKVFRKWLPEPETETETETLDQEIDKALDSINRSINKFLFGNE